MTPFFYGYSEDSKTEIVHHLLRLSDQDRSLRFFGNVNSAFIEKYVSESTKNGSFWVVVGDEGLDQIVGAMHVAMSSDGKTAEVGFSVEEDFKNQGIGTTLMEHAIAVLKATKVESMILNCLSENKAVQAICKKFGFDVTSVSFSEKEGTLKIKKEIDVKDMVELSRLTQNSIICPMLFSYAKTMKKIAEIPKIWLDEYKKKQNR